MRGVDVTCPGPTGPWGGGWLRGGPAAWTVKPKLSATQRRIFCWRSLPTGVSRSATFLATSKSLSSEFIETRMLSDNLRRGWCRWLRAYRTWRRHGGRLRRTRDFRDFARLDFRTRVSHGPGAVRLLIYRLCKCRDRVQSRVRGHLRNGLGRRVPGESVPRLCPGSPGRRQKSPVLNTEMVGGPGFEPGASRSRTLRPSVQKRRK